MGNIRHIDEFIDLLNLIGVDYQIIRLQDGDKTIEINSHLNEDGSGKDLIIVFDENGEFKYFDPYGE